MNGFLHYFLSILDPMSNLGFSRAVAELPRWWLLVVLPFALMVLPTIIVWLVYLVKPALIRLFARALLAGIAVVPTPTHCASSSPFGSPNPGSPLTFGGRSATQSAVPFTFGGRSAGSTQSAVQSAVGLLSQTQGFDAAAAHFFSLLSPGAMRAIAPTSYADFASPSGLPGTA